MFECINTIQVVGLYHIFRLFVGRSPTHSAHLLFTLPWGQGVHSAHLLFSFPWGQGWHSAHLLFSFP